MEKTHATEIEVHGLIIAIVQTWAERRTKYAKRHLSQTALGEAAGIHPMTLSRYERDAKAGRLRNIPLNDFLRVEAVLASVGAPHVAVRNLVAALKNRRKKDLSPSPLKS